MADAARLQRDLLAEVRGRYGAVSDPVAEALLAVPRHVFLPEVPPETAYRDDAIVTKRNPEGTPISSSSQPTIMALMLDQLGLSSGQRVLEIGAGTGYNAALLAHLVGRAGVVVSVDIDPDTVDRARASLAAAGFPDVTVVCADGTLGHPTEAPYDRIIATVGVWDLAPAWLEQLAPGGRIVVPLDLRGTQVSVAFERDGRDDRRWISRSLVPCGFMRLRGELAGPEQIRLLDRETGLALAMPDEIGVDSGTVWAALRGPSVVHSTGVGGSEVRAFDDLGLWLAITQPRLCVLCDEERGSPALESALVRDHNFRVTWGVVSGTGIALLRLRAVADASIELEAQGYGPDGSSLAADLAAGVRAWDAAGRPTSKRLRITACPRNTPDLDGAMVIDKRYTRLVIGVRPP